MTDPDLSLVDTNALIEALASRMDHFVVAGMQITVANQNGSGNSNVRHFWKGCGLTCVGIAHELAAHILLDRAGLDYAEEEEEEEEEEDDGP
jgi:hypothetical protein